MCKYVACQIEQTPATSQLIQEPMRDQSSAIDLIEEFRGPGAAQLNTGTAARRAGHEQETGGRHRLLWPALQQPRMALHQA